MAIYRRLFINNVTNFLKVSFPKTYDILGDKRWRLLVRDYYRDHVSEAALFPDLPKEFLAYLANERQTGKRSDTSDDPPFLYELAHYEWIETGLRLAADPASNNQINPDGDLLEDRPIVSELAWLAAYNWPVDKIDTANQPESPGESPSFFSGRARSGI